MKYMYLVLLLPLAIQAMNFNNQQENRFHYHNPNLIPLVLTPEEKNTCAGITGGALSFTIGETIGVPLFLKGISAPLALGLIPASCMLAGSGLAYYLYKHIHKHQHIFFVDVESNNLHIQKPTVQTMHVE